MTRNNRKYAAAAQSYGTRGSRVRSAEGSALGRSPAAAREAKRLAQSGAARVSRLGQNNSSAAA